jgi:hypothetical protein
MHTNIFVSISPRPNSLRNQPEPFNWPVINTAAAATAESPKCYHLKVTVEDKPQGWSTRVENDSSGEVPITEAEFYKDLDRGGKIGIKSADVDGWRRSMPYIAFLANFSRYFGCKKTVKPWALSRYSQHELTSKVE